MSAWTDKISRVYPAMLLAAGLLGLLACVGGYNYLLFHSLSELFSIAIACGMFMIAWNARRYFENAYLKMVAIGYFFVGVIDLFHMLAFRGMGVFPDMGANPATQLWIGARSLQAATLVAASLVMGRRLPAKVTAGIYATVTGLLLISVFLVPVFPMCYVEGEGLTPFKQWMEYGICLALGVAGLLLYRLRSAFDPRVLRWLLGAMGLTILSELAFTLYVEPTGPANLAGHLLKIFAFYLVYKAVIETGLAHPYAVLFREVKESEVALRAAGEQLALANERLEDKVLERTARLEETVKELEHYSYSISHDMRAPLRAMQQYSEILLADHAEKLNAEARTYLNRIIVASNRLDRLIQDVLSYSRVSREQFESEPVDLEVLTRQILDQYPAFRTEAARVTVESPLLPVRGNLAFLTQCLSNLLDNAVKFVPTGRRPEVVVRTERRGERVRIWVEDNGIGISPGDQARLFRMFVRIHGPQDFPGNGIGLSIVRKSAERMGGEAGVESAPGQGSRFWIDLPAA